MTSFADTQSIDLVEAREEIDFPIQREKLFSDQTHSDPHRDVIVRFDEDGNTLPLGIVGKRRPLIQYGEIMDWLVNEFDQADIGYKLRENLITSKGDLYQEYIFDYPVESPDGSEMVPLALVRGSHVNMPLSVEFGTYRFVCSNGVVVGDTIQRLMIDGRSGLDFLESSVVDDLHMRFDKFATVSDKYKALHDTAFTPFILEFLQSQVVPMLMKKNVMYMMQEDGNIELTVEKLKSENLAGPLDELYNVLQEQTAWYMYNTMTAYVTHKVRSLNGRQQQYRSISQFFGV